MNIFIKIYEMEPRIPVQKQNKQTKKTPKYIVYLLGIKIFNKNKTDFKNYKCLYKHKLLNKFNIYSRNSDHEIKKDKQLLIKYWSC